MTERNGQVEMGERGTSEDPDEWWGSSTHLIPPGDPLSAPRPGPRDFTRFIDRDGMGQALDQALTLPLRMGLPYVEPHQDDRGEAEFVRRCLFASASEGGMTTPIQDVQAQMTTGVTHRFAPFEMVYDSNGPEVILHKLAFRPQAKIWVLRDRNGSFNGYREKGERNLDEWGIGRPYQERFGPDKTFVYFHGGNRHPNFGESALEAPYRHHIEKLRVMQMSNEQLANHALGVWVAKYAPRASERRRRSLFDTIKNMRGGARILIGPDENLETTKQSSAGEEFRAEKAYHDSQMCLACLVQFLLLSLSTGPTGTGIGSNALSRDHSDFFTMSQESRRDEMALALTNHVAAKLVRLNFSNPHFPVIRYLPLSDNERNAALKVWETLVTATVRRVGELEFDAIQERALQALGIDVAKLREQVGEETDESTGEPAEESTPPQGDPAFRESLQNLINQNGDVQ